MGGKVGGEEHVGDLRPLQHLVLVADSQMHRTAAMRAHERLAGGDSIAVAPDPPALRRPGGPATERLRHQLVAEADPHHRHLARCGAAQEALERADPLHRIIHPVRRAGDQHRLDTVRVRQRIAVHESDRGGLQPRNMRRQQPLQHDGIAVEPVGDHVGRTPGLEDGQLHASDLRGESVERACVREPEPMPGRWLPNKAAPARPHAFNLVSTTSDTSADRPTRANANQPIQL